MNKKSFIVIGWFNFDKPRFVIEWFDDFKKAQRKRKNLMRSPKGFSGQVVDGCNLLIALNAILTSH